MWLSHYGALDDARAEVGVGGGGGGGGELLFSVVVDAGKIRISRNKTHVHISAANNMRPVPSEDVP